MEQASKIIFTLNNLIEINDQRSSLYNNLAGKAKEVELKLVYLQYAIQSETFTATLNKWRHAYGETSILVRKKSHLDQAVNQLKKLFYSNRNSRDLMQCESLESNALKIYKAAVDLTFLPKAAIDDIRNQTIELERVYSTLHTFRQNGSNQWQVAFV